METLQVFPYRNSASPNPIFHHAFPLYSTNPLFQRKKKNNNRSADLVRRRKRRAAAAEGAAPLRRPPARPRRGRPAARSAVSAVPWRPRPGIYVHMYVYLNIHTYRCVYIDVRVYIYIKCLVSLNKKFHPPNTLPRTAPALFIALGTYLIRLGDSI